MHGAGNNRDPCFGRDLADPVRFSEGQAERLLAQNGTLGVLACCGDLFGVQGMGAAHGHNINVPVLPKVSDVSAVPRPHSLADRSGYLGVDVDDTLHREGVS